MPPLFRKILNTIAGGGRKTSDRIDPGLDRRPSVDTPEAYRKALKAQFALSHERTGAALTAALQNIPDNARELHIGVHLSQDGEGGFDIMLHAIGPDLYVLNKALGPNRILFSGRTFAFEGRPANVPGFDSLDPPFEIEQVIADEAFAWMDLLWHMFGQTGLAIPVDVFAEDGWTEVFCDPRRLHEGAR